MSEVCAHAYAKDYTSTNPCKRFAKEDLKRLGGLRLTTATPEIFTVEETNKLLRVAATQEGKPLLAALVLRLFCGLRTGETFKLEWSKVRWQQTSPLVTIGDDIAKGRRVREVQIPSNAVEWLASCPKNGGRIVPFKHATDYAYAVKALAECAGVEWKPNATQHSFASYHVAKHGNSSATAAELGHADGDSLVFKHYRSLVGKTEADAYFSLTSRTVLEEPAPIRFPSAGTVEGARAATAAGG